MGETIGLTQGAFVKWHQILDLVFIANESVEEYMVNKREGVVFKIDFEKAYDYVEWDFIDHVLEKKGSEIDGGNGLDGREATGSF